MEQVKNSGMLGVLQAMTAQSELPKAAGKGDSGQTKDFQKLLDQKAQSVKTDSQTGEQAKAEKTEAVPNAKQEDAPLQEDVQTMAKRLMQAGLIAVDPSSICALQAQPAAVAEALPQEVLEETAVLPQVPGTEEIVLTEGGEELPQTVQTQTEVPAQLQTQETPETQPEELPQAVQNTETQPEEVETEFRVSERETVKPAAERPQEQKDAVEVTEAEQAPRQIFRDVEAVPVKVGEAPAAEEPEAPDVARQVLPQLTQALEKGESMVRVQLNPDSLGVVTVEISQSADGILRVALSAHSSETRSLLERHASDLQGLLAGRTQDTVQVEVQRQQESQQNQNQHPYDGHNGQDQSGRQQEQQQRRQGSGHSQDFIQQLRLGLVPGQAEEI